MILVDSSVWIDHLRRPDRALSALLLQGWVTCHPFVIGEVACGHLRDRHRMLEELSSLPQSPTTSHGEALAFVDRHAMAGRGVGWTDVHLLTSAALMPGRLWTRDKRLAAVAAALGVSFVPAVHSLLPSEDCTSTHRHPR